MQSTTSPLQRARALEYPSREAMLRRDPLVQRFWGEHRVLLAEAWNEWERDHHPIADLLSADLIHPALRIAVADAWDDPARESAVRALMDEPALGVFSFPFFDPAHLDRLRDYLEAAWDSGIPLRPPYGIVLNRRGAMLDPRSEGYLAAPAFQALLDELFATYMRPIARLVFPELVGYDGQTFGFSIAYQPDTDTSIRPHTDASAATLNINVNLPGETFTGSTVDFVDARTGGVEQLTFEPGTAMLHRGHIPHAAQPITSGERTNLVLWLMGEGGATPPDTAVAAISAADRWTVPEVVGDGWAPF